MIPGKPPGQWLATGRDKRLPGVLQVDFLREVSTPGTHRQRDRTEQKCRRIAAAGKRTRRADRIGSSMATRSPLFHVRSITAQFCESLSMPTAAPLILAVIGPGKPGRAANLQAEGHRLREIDRELRLRLLGKSRGLMQRYARVVDRPAHRGGREEVHVEILLVLEVDKIAAVGRGLRTGAGATRPAEIGIAFFSAVWIVVGVVEDPAVGAHGDAGADAVQREAFHPISILCLAGGAEEVLDHLEARPGAALGFKGVGRLFQALAESVARQELFIGPVAARREDLVGLERIVRVDEDIEVAADLP